MLRRRPRSSDPAPRELPARRPSSDLVDEPSTEIDTEGNTSALEDDIAPSSHGGSHKHKHRKTRRRSLTTFIIGGLVGLFFAGWAKSQDLVTLELIQDLRLENIIDAIPAGILKEASDITVSYGRCGNLEASSNYVHFCRNEKKK